VLFNVYIYLLFVGNGWLTLVPSHLPHLRVLGLVDCGNVCDQYVEELVAAVPELKVIKSTFSLRKATPVRLVPRNYLSVFSAGRFLQSAVASGTSNPQL